MNVSYNWLKQYVDHDLSPEALADLLTMSGLEVEDVASIGSSLDGVVIGKVLEVRAHPNADRLTLCSVDVGGSSPEQIVCGAPNVAEGQMVPVATVGTTLLLPSRDTPGDREAVVIKEAKLRGEVSRGMICAEDELGLSDDHSGIMVLRDDAAAGTPFVDYLRRHGLSPRDHVLDVSITPNRPDATSHFGVARDVSALTRTELVRPSVTLPSAGGEAAEQVTIAIEAPEACPRYVGLLVRGVTVGPSPAWLKQRLATIGLRPRNNVVDVTNYVLHEIGQPLHAFDFDQIAGHQIVVRLTQDEHPFVTLDSKERTLPEGTLMICDAEREVAVAGVMGGENSEVTEQTTNVLIESAYFDPSVIRRAAKALGLQSDASYRFERGVDRDGQVWAAARAAALIQELAGGEIVPGVVDAHPVAEPPRTVTLRPERVAALLGVPVPADDIERLLTAIGFGVAPAATDGALACTVPTFRPDVEREVDVIEEVARLYGYDRIPEPTHTEVPNRRPVELPAARHRRKARTLLAGMGLREIYTNSMLRVEQAEAFDEVVLAGDHASQGVVETLNPISQEMAALRPSLLPGMLRVMAHNSNHGQRALRFFELGHVFHRSARETVVPGYEEHEALLVGMSGTQQEAGWDTQARDVDFFDLKGVVERLLDALRIPDVRMQPAQAEPSSVAYHVDVSSGGRHLGIVARLADAVAEAHDLDEAVFFADLDWDALVALASPSVRRRYAAISRYPVVDRDIAIVVDRSTPVGSLLDTIRETGTPLLRDARVFDLYEGEHVAQGKRSVAFSLRLGADRTLRDEEVEAAVARIVAALRQAFDVSLRV